MRSVGAASCRLTLSAGGQVYCVARDAARPAGRYRARRQARRQVLIRRAAARCNLKPERRQVARFILSVSSRPRAVHKHGRDEANGRRSVGVKYDRPAVCFGQRRVAAAVSAALVKVRIAALVAVSAAAAVIAGCWRAAGAITAAISGRRDTPALVYLLARSRRDINLANTMRQRRISRARLIFSARCASREA